MNKRLILVSSISVLFLATLVAVVFLTLRKKAEEQRVSQPVFEQTLLEEKPGAVSSNEKTPVGKSSVQLSQLKEHKENKPDLLTEEQQKIFERIKKRWEQRKIYQADEFEIDLGYAEEIAFPKLPEGFAYASNVVDVFTVLNQDLTLIDEFLNRQDYTVEEFDGFYQPIKIGDSSGLVEWKIQPSYSNTINSIRKTVYADQTKTSEVKSESYWIQFYDNKSKMDFFRWRDDHEIIHFYTNNLPKEYGKQIKKYRWKILKWDEDGALEKEWVRDDSKTMNQTIQRLQDRGVLDQDGKLIRR